eukprot:2438358-Amphidinium_carterae.1
MLRIKWHELRSGLASLRAYFEPALQGQGKGMRAGVTVMYEASCWRLPATPVPGWQVEQLAEVEAEGSVVVDSSLLVQ